MHIHIKKMSKTVFNSVETEPKKCFSFFIIFFFDIIISFTLVTFTVVKQLRRSSSVCWWALSFRKMNMNCNKYFLCEQAEGMLKWNL